MNKSFVGRKHGHHHHHHHHHHHSKRSSSTPYNDEQVGSADTDDEDTVNIS
jgi:hypothetical protein